MHLHVFPLHYTAAYTPCLPLYLRVSGYLIRLVGHFLLHAGQLMFQVGHLLLVQLCQVIQLLSQSLIPVSLLLQALVHVGVVTLQLTLHVHDGILHVGLAGLDLLQAFQQSVPGAVDVVVMV